MYKRLWCLCLFGHLHFPFTSAYCRVTAGCLHAAHLNGSSIPPETNRTSHAAGLYMLDHLFVFFFEVLFQYSFLLILTDLTADLGTGVQTYVTTIPELPMSSVFKTWLCTLDYLSTTEIYTIRTVCVGKISAGHPVQTSAQHLIQLSPRHLQDWDIVEHHHGGK